MASSLTNSGQRDPSKALVTFRRRLTVALVLGAAPLVALWLAPVQPSTLPGDVRPTPAVTAHTVTASTDRDPLEAEWWALQSIFSDPQTYIGFDLGVGSFSDPATVIRRRFEPIRGPLVRWVLPQADGPIGGLVAFAYGDGRTSEVWTVDLQTGLERRVAQRAKNILAVGLDPARRRLYTVERAPQGKLLQVVALDMDSGTVTPVATLSSDLGDDGSVDLELDPELGVLVALRCGAICELAGIDVVAGTLLWEGPSDYTQLAGGSPETVLMVDTCGRPCRPRTIETLTGVATSTGFACEGAVVVPARDAGLVITDSDGERCPVRSDAVGLYVYELGSPSPLAVVSLRPDFRLVVDGYASGYSGTSNWVVAAPGGTLVSMLGQDPQVQLLSIPDGRVITPAP